MRAHEAGALHGEGDQRGHRGPSWLSTPGDVNTLVPALWARSVRRCEHGSLTVAGLDVRDIAAEFGTPAYVIDEADFRGRAAEFRQAFAEVFEDLCGGADVYYAGKAYQSGSTVDGTVFGTEAQDPIGAALTDPSSALTKAVIGGANLTTARICQTTGNKPANVCTSAGVTAAAAMQ